MSAIREFEITSVHHCLSNGSETLLLIVFRGANWLSGFPADTLVTLHRRDIVSPYNCPDVDRVHHRPHSLLLQAELELVGVKGELAAGEIDQRRPRCMSPHELRRHPASTAPPPTLTNAAFLVSDSSPEFDSGELPDGLLHVIPAIACLVEDSPEHGESSAVDLVGLRQRYHLQPPTSTSPEEFRYGGGAATSRRRAPRQPGKFPNLF